MKKTSKRLFLGLLVIIVALTLFLKFAELTKIVKLVLSANYFFILIALLFQAVVFWFVAKTYKIIVDGFNHTHIKIKTLYKTAIVMLFLNQALPSMGISGNAYLFSTLKKHDVKSGKNIFMVVFNLIVLYTSYLTLITFAIIYLLFKGNLTTLQLSAAIIMGVATVLLIAIILFLLEKASRIQKLLKFIGVFLPMNTMNSKEIVTELLAGKEQIKKEQKIFFQAVATRTASFAVECLMIAMIFFAFGITPNLIAITIAYLIATLFSLISFIPCGMGVFETTMILTFKGFSVPYEVAIITTLVFRGFAFWLPMPIGLYLYRQQSSKV